MWTCLGCDVAQAKHRTRPIRGYRYDGHAVINLNREDGGRRMFVLIEVGEHFDELLLPRIKKATYTDSWKGGTPSSSDLPLISERSPRIVKYMRLESYEDALNNVEFTDAGVQRAMELEDYVIKYMLQWETRDSATLLNIEQLSRPFDYQLATHANGNGGTARADVAETFNYLLGLRVRTRKVYYDDDRKYLVVYSRNGGREEIVVIWRETAGWSPRITGATSNSSSPRRSSKGRIPCTSTASPSWPGRKRWNRSSRSGCSHRSAPKSERAMPTRPKRRSAVKDLSYVQLEKRLVLVAWLNEQFGFQTNEAALLDAKEAAEGFNADGRSHLSVRLETRKGVQVQTRGAGRLRRQHPRPSARHQHQTRHAHRVALLPVLGGALRRGLFGWFFRRPGALLDALNRFELRRSTDSRLRDVRTDLPFTRDDLRKLAFWIATGGGKTLLLHINYHQFLRYNAALGKLAGQHETGLHVMLATRCASSRSPSSRK